MAGCSFGPIMLLILLLGILATLVIFFYGGAFDIKSFLNGFHNDDVFYNSPLDFLYGLEDHELWNIDIVLGTSNWIYVMMPI
jgi:esterase/lipase superfamily enzyme